MLSHRIGQAVRHEYARRVEAPEGARARGAHHAQTRGTVAALQDRRGPVEASRCLDRALPPHLGGASRSVGHVPTTLEAQGGEESWSYAAPQIATALRSQRRLILRSA